MLGGVGRWQPDARDRFRQAAVELFDEQGFEDTTVAEIAERAGLTKRTFFRHYADKREVLFEGSAALQERMVVAVVGAPAGASTLDAVAEAVQAAATSFQGDREAVRRRHAVVTATAELQERELVKLATLSAALADALRGRGAAEPAASLAAESGTTVFRLAVSAWATEADPLPLTAIVDELFTALRTVAAQG